MRITIPPARAIAMLALLAVVLIAGSVTFLLAELRDRALGHARMETLGLAHIFREQSERTFDGVDVMLRGVQERMQAALGVQLPLESGEVRLLLGARVFAMRQVSELALVDARGVLVNSSRGDRVHPAPVDDQDYFKALAGRSDDTLFVGRPRQDGPDGGWTLTLSRPFSGADGRFRGVAVATLNIPRFDHDYGWMKLAYPRPMALYLDDGTLVASVPHRANVIGDRAPELGSTRLAAVGTQVSLATHVRGDGGREEFAIARVGRFPLLVGVTNDQEPALAAWREESVPIVLGAVLVCLFVYGAATALKHELAREARLARALRDAHDRYHRTIDSLLDAIVAVDGQQRVILFNPAAEQMFGVRASEISGQPLSRLLPERSRAAHGRAIDNFARSGGASRAMSPSVDITGLRADGTEFPIESTISQTMVDGKPQLTAVLRDVTRRRKAQADLKAMNQQLRSLSASLQDVREQERSRIAMELHDDLGQQLTGLKLELSWLGRRLKEGQGGSPDDVDTMRHQLDRAIGSVRRIATELRPPILDDLGLREALEWQVEEFGRRSGLRMNVALEAVEDVVARDGAIALYRIVQESLTNVAKHATGATQVHVSLAVDNDRLVLVVSDDGAGLSPAVVGSAGNGIGLVSMRERAMSLGGRLAVTGRPGGGTRIEVSLPLQMPETEAA